MDTFIRGCGFSLILGGACTVLINLFITPFMPLNHTPDVMITNIFLVRAIASAFAGFFLLAGTIGLHLAQRPQSGLFGSLAFVVAFIGSGLRIAIEFANVFVLRAVAQIAPETAQALDKSRLFNTGFALAVGFFAVGWLLMSINAWKTGLLPRWAAITTLAGLILISILQLALGKFGAIAGNAVFGAGLIGLGWSLVLGNYSVKSAYDFGSLGSLKKSG
jgi:hypothetical protein